MNYFSSNLKYLRKRSGKNQDKCGLELNLPRATLSNYETGLTEPDVSKLIEIADYFGISIEKLLYENLQNDSLNDFRTTQKKQKDDSVNDSPNDSVNSHFKVKTEQIVSESEVKFKAINQQGHIIQYLSQTIAAQEVAINTQNALIAQLSADNERLKKESITQKGNKVFTAKKVNAV